MNRKERLKITRTPEKGFIYADESLYLPSPKPKVYAEIKEEDVLPFRIEDRSSWKSNIKRYVLYAHVLIPYLLMIYLYFTNKTSNVMKLMEEINSLKNEKINLVRKGSQKRLFNVARIEFGTSVVIEEGLYKYGLLGFRTYNDPNIILNDNFTPGDCLAISNDTGTIIIQFKCNLLISKIGIFHPDTSKRDSAIKDFEIFDSNGAILGKFKYDISKERYQYFDFPAVKTDHLKIKILSNNGCGKYTTLYKIFVYGRVE